MSWSNPIYDWIFENLDLSKLGGKRILELGCNDGRNTAVFAEKYNVKVYGFDINQEFIQRGLSKKPDSIIEILDPSQMVRFVCGDVYNLPFKDKTFDLIYSAGTFPCLSLEQIKRGLEEAYRVLDFGGFAAIDLEVWADQERVFKKTSPRMRDFLHPLVREKVITYEEKTEEVAMFIPPSAQISRSKIMMYK